jgi:hypothetical protein
MPKALQYHTAVMIETRGTSGDVVENSVTTALVCGGATTFTADSAQSACYSYAPDGDAWTNALSLKTARWAHGMAVYKGTHTQRC